MERTLLLVTVSAFLFQTLQSKNFSVDVLVPSDNENLSWKSYEKSAKNFASKHLNDTKFCESILLPTDHTLLKKSLQATLFNARNETDLNDKGRLDSCCRSLHKCEAYKNIELNGTKESSIPHCQCVHNFRICLKQLNTSLSSDLAFIHSTKSTKCYARDHPTIKCIKLETYTAPKSLHRESMSSTLNKIFFSRCIQYAFDDSQPKQLQLFDLPFIAPTPGSVSSPQITDAKPRPHGDATLPQMEIPVKVQPLDENSEKRAPNVHKKQKSLVPDYIWQKAGLYGCTKLKQLYELYIKSSDEDTQMIAELIKEAKDLACDLAPTKEGELKDVKIFLLINSTMTMTNASIT